MGKVSKRMHHSDKLAEESGCTGSGGNSKKGIQKRVIAYEIAWTKQGMFTPKSSRLGEVGDKGRGHGTGQEDWRKLVKDQKTIKSSRFIFISKQWDITMRF